MKKKQSTKTPPRSPSKSQLAMHPAHKRRDKWYFLLYQVSFMFIFGINLHSEKIELIWFCIDIRLEMGRVALNVHG